MVMFNEIASALIYFLKEKSAAIYPISEICGWDSTVFRQHMDGVETILTVTADDEVAKVLLLQLSTQSWDDVQDGEQHELVDTRTFVHDLKQQNTHMKEIRKSIQPLRPKNRQKLPSKKRFFPQSEDSIYETDSALTSSPAGKRSVTLPPPLPVPIPQSSEPLKKRRRVSSSPFPIHSPSRPMNSDQPQSSTSDIQTCQPSPRMRHASSPCTAQSQSLIQDSYYPPFLDSVDLRGFNQEPNSSASLSALKGKLEKTFGFPLDSSRGCMTMQLILYRQNVKILSELEHLKQRFSSSNPQVNSASTTEIVPLDEIGIPLNSVASFEQFCKRVSLEPDFKEKCLNFFKRLGGADTMDAVRRFIDALMTNTTQRKFNRMGKKGKHRFDIIEDILLKPVVSSIVQCTNHQQIEECVATHLTNARDRVGGRKEREVAAVKSKSMLSTEWHDSDSSTGHVTSISKRKQDQRLLSSDDCSD